MTDATAGINQDLTVSPEGSLEQIPTAESAFIVGRDLAEGLVRYGKIAGRPPVGVPVSPDSSDEAETLRAAVLKQNFQIWKAMANDYTLAASYARGIVSYVSDTDFARYKERITSEAGAAGAGLVDTLAFLGESNSQGYVNLLGKSLVHHMIQYAGLVGDRTIGEYNSYAFVISIATAVNTELGRQIQDLRIGYAFMEGFISAVRSKLGPHPQGTIPSALQPPPVLL
jgi:hypothetical protein